MEEVVKILKDRGIKVTSQRVEVLELLKRSQSHMAIDEIFEKIHKKQPMVSLATIYAILDTFKKQGLVQELRILPDKSCYNVRVDAHHHFYCRKCKNIFDIDIPLCLTMSKREVQEHLIEECQGLFYGICKKCRGL